jgi:hypothetical protein
MLQEHISFIYSKGEDGRRRYGCDVLTAWVVKRVGVPIENDPSWRVCKGEDSILWAILSTK